MPTPNGQPSISGIISADAALAESVFDAQDYDDGTLVALVTPCVPHRPSSKNWNGLIFGVVIGIIVGIIIVYQVLSTDVANHLANMRPSRPSVSGNVSFLA